MLKWDHIIHYIDDLEDFKFPDDVLKIYPGGRHEALGTFNMLSYFDLSYIEFIDVFDAALLKDVSETSEGRLSFAASLHRTGMTEGFKRLCFRTDDIEKLAQHFVQNGEQVIGPVQMSRTKPDGEVITWQLLYIDDDRSDRELPFFIEWGASDAARTTQLKPMFQPMRVLDIKLMTKNKPALISMWQRLFGATYDGALKLSDGPSFTIIEGESESIVSIMIESDIDLELDVRGAKYIFKRRPHHTVS